MGGEEYHEKKVPSDEEPQGVCGDDDQSYQPSDDNGMPTIALVQTNQYAVEYGTGGSLDLRRETASETQLISQRSPEPLPTSPPGDKCGVNPITKKTGIRDDEPSKEHPANNRQGTGRQGVWETFEKEMDIPQSI